MHKRLVIIMKTLIVHLDLNRTVLMSDSSGSRSMEDTLNYLLSEVAYGTVVSQSDNSTRWVCSTSVEPSSTNPQPSQLVSYKEYIDSQYLYITKDDVVPHGHTSAADFNKSQKEMRKAAQSSFTHNGQPGETFAPTLRQLLARMHFTEEGGYQEAARSASRDLPPCLLRDTWASGRYFLLPSFLKLLLNLQENHPGMVDIDHVRIVYRTYGRDLEEVARELDIFANGKHPLFPGKILDRRLTIRRPFSTFFRQGTDPSSSFIAKGTLERPPTLDLPDVSEFYSERGIHVVKGFSNIANAISEMLEESPHRSLGFRDHWEFWHAQGESDNAGKPLFVSDLDCNQGQVHCFVDDHVERHRSHIIDVRRAGDTGESIAFDACIGKLIFRAEPYDAILDDNYFVRLFEMIADIHDIGEKDDYVCNSEAKAGNRSGL